MLAFLVSSPSDLDIVKPFSSRTNACVKTAEIVVVVPVLVVVIVRTVFG